MDEEVGVRQDLGKFQIPLKKAFGLSILCSLEYCTPKENFCAICFPHLIFYSINACIILKLIKSLECNKTADFQSRFDIVWNLIHISFIVCFLFIETFSIFNTFSVLVSFYYFGIFYGLMCKCLLFLQ